MKKYISGFILILLMVVGCKKADIPTYTGENYIQFDSTVNVNTFSFCYSGSDATFDTVFLDVKIAGVTANHDRVVSVKQVKEYKFQYSYNSDGHIVDSALVEVGNQAIEGVHYEPFSKPEAQKLLVVKPNEVRGKIGIIVKRHSSLKKDDIRLNIEIMESSDFKVGDIHSTKATLVIMDKLTRPDGWNHQTGPHTDPEISMVWGVYGPVKHQFMIDHSPSKEKWDADFFKEVNLDQGKMLWYASTFQKELEKQNAERAALGLKPLMEDPDNPNTIVEF